MSAKFAGNAYKVCHLAGQWWADDCSDFHNHPLKEWQWRLLIRVPEFITRSHVDAAIKTVIEKGKSTVADHVKLEQPSEGRCVQMLHIGPYGEERVTIGRMQELAESNGVHLRGPHQRDLRLRCQPRPAATSALPPLTFVPYPSVTDGNLPAAPHLHYTNGWRLS